MEEAKPKKILTEAQAFLKICNWCAFQERTQQEVRDKLYTYGLHQQQVELMISRVINEGFLSEERFAMAYAGGKFRMLGWGREKIKAGLKFKRVSDYCIRKALAQIDDKDYHQKLKSVIAKRGKEVKEKTLFKRNYKLAQYAISRGFESDLVWEILRANQE